jgi:hypothetical protein
MSKNRLAALLKTSCTQVDRLLSAREDNTLSSLQRAAAVVVAARAPQPPGWRWRIGQTFGTHPGVKQIA